MSASEVSKLPATFNRLAWSNLAAQSAEQIALAAAPIVAVLMLGVAEGETGLLQTALTLPFILFAIPAGLLTDRISRRETDGGGGGAARRGTRRDPGADRGGLADVVAPRFARLHRGLRHGRLQRGGAGVGALSGDPQLLPAANARIELARTIAFASGPRSAACWSAGSARHRPSALPLRSR